MKDQTIINLLLESVEECKTNTELISLSKEEAQEAIDYITYLLVRLSEFATALYETDPNHPLVTVPEVEL